MRWFSLTLLGLCLVFAAWSLRPAAWLVEQVVFEGAHRATNAELRHLSDLRNGTRIWDVDAEAIARGVARHPWVARAQVTREWPRTVRIRLDEHVPVALVHQDEELLVLSAQGVPFARALPGDLDFPHITGTDASGHPDLPALIAREGLGLLARLDERGLVPRSAVSEVAFSDTLGFTVIAGRGRLAFAHDHLDRQVDRLAALVARGVDPLGPQYVDLAPATVAIVRPLAPAPAGG